MPHPFSIRLDDDLDARLERIARLTGRTKSFYVKQALEDQIQDLEDLYLARRVAKRVAEGRERVIPLEELERELGVDRSSSPRAPQSNSASSTRRVARRITAYLRERVASATDPRSLGAALKGDELGQFWKYRVGDYRIIAEIHDREIRIRRRSARPPSRRISLNRMRSRRWLNARTHGHTHHQTQSPDSTHEVSAVPAGRRPIGSRGRGLGDPVYAATDVHAWLENIARGKRARRPKPTSG